MSWRRVLGGYGVFLATLSRRTLTPLRLTKITFAQLVAHANKISPRTGLRLCPAGLSLFDPLRQPLIASSNLAQFQANITSCMVSARSKISLARARKPRANDRSSVSSIETPLNPRAGRKLA